MILTLKKDHKSRYVIEKEEGSPRGVVTNVLAFNILVKEINRDKNFNIKKV